MLSVQIQQHRIGPVPDEQCHVLFNWADQHAKRRRRMAMNLLVGSSLYEQCTKSERVHLTERFNKRYQWLISLKKIDPRYQILEYFDEVARKGGALEDPIGPPLHSFDLMRGFAKSASFTVWRPTSREAICRMMKGEATGKGLDIKGKSAKCGVLSGLVPFLQIHQNYHKCQLRRPPKYGRISIYHKSSKLRDLVKRELKVISSEMEHAVMHSKLILSNENSDEDERESAMSKLAWEVEDWEIYSLNEYGFGLDVPERVFFEAYIMRQNIHRSDEEEIGRKSEPAFQDMNFGSTRKYSGTGPRAVVLQTSKDEKSLRPQTLVIAYEEQGRVVPVASDFDCFTVGTRGVAYDSPMPKEQVDLMKWLINHVEEVLSERNEKGWTSRWLDILKENMSNGFHPEVPKYGFGDPKSSAIVEGAVARFTNQRNGAIRHGAECFNYLFPQELDDEFLVISDTLPGKLPWKYVDVDELKDMLLEKVDDGFCFPINPKWILADNGWKRIYDKMLASTCSNTQISLETWYPKESGVREMIEAVHQKFPDGFVGQDLRYSLMRVRSEAMHLAEDKLHLAEEELRRHLVLKRAKNKLRAALLMKRLLDDSRRKLCIDSDLSTEVGEGLSLNEAGHANGQSSVTKKNNGTNSSSMEEIKIPHRNRCKLIFCPMLRTLRKRRYK